MPGCCGLAPMAGKGEVCYFHRDLKKGSYGGDVSCLQAHLKEGVSSVQRERLRASPCSSLRLTSADAGSISPFLEVDPAEGAGSWKLLVGLERVARGSLGFAPEGHIRSGPQPGRLGRGR